MRTIRIYAGYDCFDLHCVHRSLVLHVRYKMRGNSAIRSTNSLVLKPIGLRWRASVSNGVELLTRIGVEELTTL